MIVCRERYAALPFFSQVDRFRIVELRESVVCVRTFKNHFLLLDSIYYKFITFIKSDDELILTVIIKVYYFHSACLAIL